jgi:hypothetical protein
MRDLEVPFLFLSWQVEVGKADLVRDTQDAFDRPSLHESVYILQIFGLVVNRGRIQSRDVAHGRATFNGTRSSGSLDSSAEHLGLAADLPREARLLDPIL